jgi:hypothetical protein
MDCSLFYHSEENPNDVPLEAIEACAKCEVRQECAEWAIRHEAFGYHGGMTQAERARIRRKERIMLVEPQSNLGIGIGSRVY